MQKKRNRNGFSLAELLIVVAIIVVLSGVGFVAVQRYERGLAQLERDAIAKEIFVAAQNHLTVAESQGYLGIGPSGYGTRGDADADKGEEGAKKEIYYFAVHNDHSFTADSSTLLDLMLPYASIDETVRAGGSYIIRYQANPAVVLDVFYCPSNARRFPYTLKSGDYAELMRDWHGADKKTKRRNYKSAVLGWYGGAADLETGGFLNTPSIEVENAERLLVRVTDPNEKNEFASIKLIITGKTSGARAAIQLNATDAHFRVTKDTSSGQCVYTVVLDDITNDKTHFADLNGDSSIDRVGAFSPGEDISVSAVSYSNTALTNIAYSSEQTTNSLFADIADVGIEGAATAMIGNIRHLENLDAAISNLDNANNTLNLEAQKDQIKLAKAVQIADLSAPAPAAEGEAAQPDLSWPGFVSAIGGTVKIHGFEDGESTKDNCFRPVSPTYALSYDGGYTEGEGEDAVAREHSISGIVVDTGGLAGLFGAPAGGFSASNLALIDFNINGTGNAGALAGMLNKATISNVAAYGAAAVVNAGTLGGGLIGSAGKSTVDKCAAALIVTSQNDAAGGLIGATDAETQVSASYSGGHTTNGAYTSDNVTAANGVAGGLIGNAYGATVTGSYSTCSVNGMTAGGLVGSASGSISNCYATGRVRSDAETPLLGAFAGSFTGGTATGCLFYEIINEDLPAAGDAGQPEGIAPLDETAASYDAFVGKPGDWQTAQAYDAGLANLFGENRYSLRTVRQLAGSAAAETDVVAVHHGDWPAPETLTINATE